MNKKSIVGIIVAVLVLLGVMGAVVGLGASSDGSKLKEALAKDVAQKASYEEVKKQLTDMGCELGTSTPTEIQALGANHSMLLFSARVTVKVGFDSEGKANSYEVGK